MRYTKNTYLCVCMYGISQWYGDRPVPVHTAQQRGDVDVNWTVTEKNVWNHIYINCNVKFMPFLFGLKLSFSRILHSLQGAFWR